MMRSVKSVGLFLYITAHEIASRKHCQQEQSTLSATVSATVKHAVSHTHCQQQQGMLSATVNVSVIACGQLVHQQLYHHLKYLCKHLK